MRQAHGEVFGLKLKKLPWVFKTKDLNKWEKQGVELFTGKQAQLVFLDYGEPLALCFSRPLKLDRDRESKIVLGTFLFDYPELDFREWVVGFYADELKAFVVVTPPDIVKFVIENPRLFSYLDLKERAAVKPGLEEFRWKLSQKTQKLRLDSEQPLSSPIFSSKERPRPQRLSGPRLHLRSSLVNLRRL